METDFIGTIIGIVISMLFSAFFSGMEIAFVSSNKLRFEVDNSKKGVVQSIVSMFYHNSNNFISTMLVGNNIVLVIYGILMGRLIMSFLAFAGIVISNEALLVLIQTLISTLIILFTGEYLPKTIFRINPNKTIQMFAIPAFVCYVVLYPISKFSTAISRLFLKLFGYKIDKETSDKAFTKLDLDYFIQSSIENTANEEEIDDELKIFQNALDFSNTKIRDCMIPRTEIEAVEKSISFDELNSKFIESGKSKIIVYEDSIDNIVGYIHSSELFKRKEEWNKAIRDIPIVPETMAAQKLLHIFMQKKKSVAVVVDEFGGTAGIITIEDLFEEIFGEIEDEHDSNNYITKQISDNEFILSARLEVSKTNEMFSLDIPESDDYQTIGGLILATYQGFPKLNETVSAGKFHFKVIKLSATKIELVKLKVS